MANYLIVSCDGGGIRGLIPALFLQQLNKVTGTAGFLTDGSVGMYAGTSAGSFIALGLAGGKPIDTIVSMFQNDGASIFQAPTQAATPTPRPAPPPPRPAGSADGSWWDTLWQMLLNDWTELVYTKYGNTGLKGLLSGLFPSNQPLSQLAPVVVTTFQMSTGSNGGTWAPLLLGNLSTLPNASTVSQVGIVDAAMASSAAPTYFPPYQPPNFNYCADGGLAANNPAVLALVQALQAGKQASNVYLLSLGTGASPDAMPNSTVNTIGQSLFGPLTWMFPEASPAGITLPATPLLTGLFDASSEVFDYLAGTLLPATNYLRVNPPLPSPIALDDYSPAAITAMTDAVSNYSGWTTLTNWLQTALGS